MANGYTQEQVVLATAAAQLRTIDEAATDLVNWCDYANSVTFGQENGTSTPYRFSMDVAYAQALQRPSATACAYINEFGLRSLRARSRAFCSQNPYWMAVRRHLSAYAVGTGHVVSVVPRNPKKGHVDADLSFKIQEEIEKFQKANLYRRFQSEKITRLDRDGEFFVRFSTDKLMWRGEEEIVLAVDFVEPILIQDPPGMGPHTNTWFGLQYDDQRRYARPLGYYIKTTTYDGGMTADMDDAWRTMVPASEIQHRTANVDLSSPRGVPSTYAIEDSLTQALSTLKSMGKLVDIRARIALIRKQVNATLAQIQPLLLRNRSGSAEKGGLVRNAFNFPFGTILDSNDQRTYEFPSQNIETDKIVHSLKADLQSCAAAMGLADFTLAADSSSHFSSALVKEGPMDRSISCVQMDLIEDDIECYDRHIQIAVDEGRLPKNALEVARIVVEPPGVIARERLQNCQADEILWRCGAISSSTMAMRANLDPDDEKARGAEPQTSGSKRSLQPSLKGGKPGRSIPKGAEPGVGLNPNKYERPPKLEGLDEAVKPTEEDVRVASKVITPDWIAKIKGDLLSLPRTGAPIRNSSVSEYEPGIPGTLLGTVNGRECWGVDFHCLAVKYDAPDASVAANHNVWGFVPEDKMLVDWTNKIEDVLHLLLQELIEQHAMEAIGWNQTRAKRFASTHTKPFLLELRPELQVLVKN